MTGARATAVGIVVLAVTLGIGPCIAEAEGPGWSWYDTRDVAADAFGAGVSAYVANIADCESGNDPSAEAAGWDSYWGPYHYVGLLQIGVMHQYRADWLFEQGLIPSPDLFNPITNIYVAADIYQDQGFGAWPFCSR